MKQTFLILLPVLVIALTAGEISMKRILPPNLLKNGDFSQKKR